MTLPHCIGCTEPGAVTHQQETVEHVHDVCNATIVALRAALQRYYDWHHMGFQEYTERYGPVSWREDGQLPDVIPVLAQVHAALDHPIPSAATKLLAERDAARALYEALEDADLVGAPLTAYEAYRTVIEGT